MMMTLVSRSRNRMAAFALMVCPSVCLFVCLPVRLSVSQSVCSVSAPVKDKWLYTVDFNYTSYPSDNTAENDQTVQ